MGHAIDWEIPGSDWDRLFAMARRPSLLQHRAYADAVCPGQGQRARRGAIRIGGEVAGLVQIQEASLMRRAIHALILDRGPVWLPGHGGEGEAHGFFAALARAFPARPGRRRRVIPELSRAQAGAMGGTGLAMRGPGYQTYWLDLSPQPEALRARLKGKWRNMLVKAEAAGVEIGWDWSGAGLGALLAAYRLDRAGKGYDGPSPATVVALARGFMPRGGLGIATAHHRGMPVAGALFLVHGRAATYQIGWVADAGRRIAANHLLLWEAMLALRDRGIADLDLGGVNDGGAAAIKRFKAGLGGDFVELAGRFG